MTDSHHIVINNFTHKETVTYPLILIRGHVNKFSNQCQSQQHEEKIVIYYSDCEKYANLSGINFKFVLELKLGDNHIKLQYCCEILELKFEYTPCKSEYIVYPLYIICQGHNGSFQAPDEQNNSKENACKRIHLIAKILQCVTAEKLHEKMLSRKTFALENECRIFYSELSVSKASKMDKHQLWEYLAREIMKSEIGNSKKKYLGFLSCTKYNGEKYDDSMTTYEDLLNITETYIALGGGGLALFGSGSLYTCPENVDKVIDNLIDQTAIDKRKFLDDSCYRGTYGGCFSTSLGSVLHELCHTFDLGHSECGIMARGFDNIHKVFIPHSDDEDNIISKFQKTIEFKESLEPNLLSERLKNKPKEFKITGTSLKERNVDDTFWTKSCATILYYHKWFNNYPEKSHHVLKFDGSSKAFTSTAGLRVVEIRRLCDELVFVDWVFDGKILKYSFQIPLEIEKLDNFPNFLIVAEDNVGNIIKFDFSKF
ncbi:hypothetical protein WA026_008359 [Henosepilachna vigintioctopunctata]|uniref:Zinc metalloproteinase n=1 Tax=Henosepilachna vigintioctopunctata TaxID=420089 RepID=A0AAW1UFP0_9CUCU